MTTNGRFVVQFHASRSAHYDFRLEAGGMYVSWALPKGPPDAAGERRLAIRTPDHELSFGAFEGVIPSGEYGAGTISLWDQGTYDCDQTINEGLVCGLLRFTLRGERLRGAFVLEKLRRGRWRDKPESRDWILIRITG